MPLNDVVRENLVFYKNRVEHPNTSTHTTHIDVDNGLTITFRKGEPVGVAHVSCDNASEAQILKRLRHAISITSGRLSQLEYAERCITGWPNP